MTAKIPTPCDASTILLTTGCLPVEWSKIWFSWSIWVRSNTLSRIYNAANGQPLHSIKRTFVRILTTFESRLICRNQIFRLILNYLDSQYVYRIEAHTRNSNECD
jgi:hypothetical protein